MFKVGKIEIEKAVLLAPMEDITDISFRLLCHRLGADIVYTEFVNAEGLIRSNQNTHKKLRLHPDERPVAIQIYGANLQSMIQAAKIAEEEGPEFIDINAGCWVKNVFNSGAGSGLLKDPCFMQEVVASVVKSVSLPVTVKTRLGIDNNNIKILEIAKRIEDAGASALVLHCRTRKQGNSGEVDWSWIDRVKEVVNMPVGLNGNVLEPSDAIKAFNETNADAVMIARGAIGKPWIFKEVKELIRYGKLITNFTSEEKIKLCLDHLKMSIAVKGEMRATIEHRKFYSGYLKGLYNASEIRMKLMTLYEYSHIEELLLGFVNFLKQKDDVA